LPCLVVAHATRNACASSSIQHRSHCHYPRKRHRRWFVRVRLMD
jgi:hypothetical protein